jgi:hypothetical protein
LWTLWFETVRIAESIGFVLETSFGNLYLPPSSLFQEGEREMVQEDIAVVIKRLRDSKTKVQQLSEQLDKEKANGKQLYEKFMDMQGDLRDAFGIDPVKGKRRGAGTREKSPENDLRYVAGRAVLKAVKDGKKPAEAKEIAMAAALSVAKEKHAMQALPQTVLKRIDKVIAKRYRATRSTRFPAMAGDALDAPSMRAPIQPRSHTGRFGNLAGVGTPLQPTGWRKLRGGNSSAG